MIGFFGKKMLLTQHVNYLLRGVTKRSKYQTMRCVSQCVIFSMEISMEAYFERCFAFGSPLFDFNNNCFADSEVIMSQLLLLGKLEYG